MKSGFVTLVGRSNVGKSTLLNALVGTKIAITSPKPQTTRFPIHGIVHDERGQIVFVDTPGIFEKAQNRLTEILNERARESVRDIDVVLYIADPTRAIGNEEHITLRLIENLTIPKILVINKIDKRELPYLAEYEALRSSFSDMIQVSALRGTHLEELKTRVLDLLPEGIPHYDDYQVSNLENKTWLSELIREKIFIQMGAELPYTVAVEIETTEERTTNAGKTLLYIKANILTTNDRYKKMIIGSGGHKIKELGSVARKELEAILSRPVFLDLEVSVDEHWAERLA